MPRVAGVLGGDEVHLGQHLDRPLGQVGEVADGGGDEVEGGGGDLVFFRHGRILSENE